MFGCLFVSLFFFGSAVGATLFCTDILNVSTTGNPSGSIFDASANNFQRNFNHISLWLTSAGDFALRSPNDGDSINADFSSSLCDANTDPKFYHAALTLNTSTAVLKNITLSTSRKCVATVRVVNTGILNADTIVVKSGVQLVLEGLIACKTFVLETGAVIFGSGTVNCDSVQLDGDVAPGYVFFTSASKGYASGLSFVISTDCAPSYAPLPDPSNPFGSLPPLFNQSYGQMMTFRGLAVVTGTIWIDFKTFQGFATNAVRFANVTFSGATVHLTQTFKYNSNVSISCIFFDHVVGSVNVFTTMTNYSGTELELPWIQRCANKCFQFNCLAQEGFCGTGPGCTPTSPGACAQEAPTSLSVLALPTVDPSCSSAILSASTEISTTTSSSLGNGSSSSSTQASTTQASGGLSTTTIIILATVIPGAVLVAAGFAFLIYFLRKREVAKRHERFSSKQKSRFMVD